MQNAYAPIERSRLIELGPAHTQGDAIAHVQVALGETDNAIRELERSGVRAAFLNAITAATERSRELSERVSS